MFSADVLCAKQDFPPKNGPVPIQAVNAYHPLASRGEESILFCAKIIRFFPRVTDFPAAKNGLA